MKVKLHFEYDEIIDDVVKIVPSEPNWSSLEIYTSKGLHAIPNDQVTYIEVIDDGTKS